MPYRYEKAPITEALIDFRVLAKPEPTIQTLDTLYKVLQDRYPIQRKQSELRSEVNASDEGVVSSAHQSQVGFRYEDQAGTQILQAVKSGFTFSRLRPYLTWAELRDEARRLWDEYKAHVNVTQITRIAVRYINQIDIPCTSFDFKDYFRTCPEISPELPQQLGAFRMQLQLPQPDFGGHILLTQATIASASPGVVSVVLDLDVSKPDLAWTADDDAWSALETLRARKNQYFEGCITDKTRALFGGRIAY